MAIKILMPALSPTMEMGTILRWLVKEGDFVKLGDLLVEIETDKATMEVEAVDDGILGKIIIGDGTKAVKINTVIALLQEEGETAEALAQVDVTLPKSSRSALADDREKVQASLRVQESPTSRPLAEEKRIFASPLARRMAKEYHLNLENITGSAVHGRIILADVERAKAQVSVKAVNIGYTAVALSAMPEFREVKPDNIRKTIARRLVQSKQEVPHFYVTLSANITALLALRAEYNSRFPEKADKISVNDFMIKASALALRDVPDANGAWLGNVIHYYQRADISVAVASPKGLITPIIRDAENKPIAFIANEMKQLVARARAGKLQPIDYEGGSFSISNLGMFGIDEFKAIINPPQGAILAVGAAKKTPIYDASGDLVPADLLALSLSADHRVIDGVVGAQFMAALKQHLENPLWLFL